MIVEIYGLKCFSLGALICLYFHRKWIKFCKTKTFEIKDMTGWENRP